MLTPYSRTPRRWKGRLYNYDWIAEQTGSMCYCLSNTTVQLILAITETFYWHTRWEGNELFTEEQLAQIKTWASIAEDELMSGCCGESTEILRRVNPLTGEYEKSTDGGTTWEPDPYSDPRNTSIQYAPLSGEDGDVKRCLAAENVTRMFQGDVTDFVAALGVISGYAQFVLILAATFAVVLSAGAAAPAVAALANVLISLGASTITATMTTDVYNAFKCIVYCSMDESGKLSSGSMQTMKDKIYEEIPEAYDILALLMDNYGILGLNNLATLQGAGDGDTCSECDCPAEEWCVNFDFSTGDDYGFTSSGTWDGTGFISTDPVTVGGQPRYRAAAVNFFDVPVGSRLTAITMYFTRPGACDDCVNEVGVTAEDGQTPSIEEVVDNLITTGFITSGLTTLDWDGAARVYAAVDSEISGEAKVTRVWVSGTGEIPTEWLSVPICE